MEYIYAAPVDKFIDDVNNGIIVDMIIDNAMNINVRLDQAQIEHLCMKSFQLKQILDQEVNKDVYVLLGVKLPFTDKLVDYMLFGTHGKGAKSMEYVSIKPWSNHESYDEIEYGSFKVGSHVEVHPSEETNELYNYHKYYFDNYNEHLQVGGVTYFPRHNIDHTNPSQCLGVYDSKYFDYNKMFRIYSKKWQSKVLDRIREKVGNGEGHKALDVIMRGAHHPAFRSKTELVEKLYYGETRNFVILDRQIIAHNCLISSLKNNINRKIYVLGESGTGFDILAFRLLKTSIKNMNEPDAIMFTMDKELLEAQADILLKDSNLLPIIFPFDHYLRHYRHNRYYYAPKVIIVDKSFIEWSEKRGDLDEVIDEIENFGKDSIIVYFNYIRGALSENGKDVAIISDPVAAGEIFRKRGISPVGIYPRITHNSIFIPEEEGNITPEEREWRDKIRERMRKKGIGPWGNYRKPKIKDPYIGEMCIAGEGRSEIGEIQEIGEHFDFLEIIDRVSDEVIRVEEIHPECEKEKEVLPSNSDENEAEIWSTIFGGAENKD